MLTSSQELLQKAIEAAKAKRPAEALRILKEVVLLEPRSETAWLWLSRLLESDKQRIVCLRNVLVVNPDNEAAREELNILKERAATIKPLPEGAEEPAALVMPGTAAPGVASGRPPAERHEAPPAIQPWRVDADDKTRLDTEGRRKASGCTLFVLGGVGGALLLLIGFLLAGALGLIGWPGGVPPSSPIHETLEEPTPTAATTPTPDPDYLYFACFDAISDDSAELTDDMLDMLRLADAMGDAEILCAGQLSWAGLPSDLTELRAAHANCPLPTDARLRRVQENFDLYLQDDAAEAGCMQAYCDSGDPDWFEEAATHAALAVVHLERLRDNLDQYRPDFQ